MAFEPNKEYKAEITSYSLTEDNDGKPEIHIGVGLGPSGATYKMKFNSEEAKKKSLCFALRFGAERGRLSNPAYLEQWGLGLTGRECHIRTKQWEMNSKTGVFISQISPKPFLPVAVAVASAFNSLASLEILDDDLPF